MKANAAGAQEKAVGVIAERIAASCFEAANP